MSLYIMQGKEGAREGDRGEEEGGGGGGGEGMKLRKGDGVVE